MVEYTREQIAKKYTEVQDLAIEKSEELVEDAKNRRNSIKQQWNKFQLEMRGIKKEKILEKLGEKDEKKFWNYAGAKGILNGKAGSQLKFMEETEVRKVMAMENEVDQDILQLQQAEMGEAKALRAEMELADREFEELEKLHDLLKQKKGKLLTDQDYMEVEQLLTQS